MRGKQPRGAGGVQKSKTQTELGGRKGRGPCFSCPGEARQRGGMFSSGSSRPREEECFPLDLPSYGGLASPLRTHPDPPHKAVEERRGPLFSASSIPWSSGNFPAQPGAVPRNLARAQVMLASHSTQISPYLLAEWARGACSEAEESQECEAWDGQCPQWLFVTGLREAGQAEQVCFTKTKILPGAISRGSEGKKMPSSL